MVSPVHGDYRRCQAEIPLIVLFRFPGPALSYVTSYDGWHRNSDRHLRFEEDQLGIRAIVRWLGLADNTERIDLDCRKHARSQWQVASDPRLSPWCPRKVFFLPGYLTHRGSFNVLPRKRSEVCGRFRLGLQKKKKPKGGGR